MKYLLLQTAIGDYRQQVMNYLLEKLGDDFHVLTGRDYFNKTTKTSVSIRGALTFVNNFFIFGRRALWQFGVIGKAINAPCVILEFNPRIISNWVIIVARKFSGRKTAFWGHAWGRKGIKSNTAFLRKFYGGLADVMVVYTETQKNEVRNDGFFSGPVIPAPNALYRKSSMFPAIPDSEPISFLYIGRLVEEKCVDRLVRAFSLFLENKKCGQLLIVGDGPIKFSLENLSRSLGCESSVLFLGHISNPDELSKIYSKSICSISPGYVGLSITQSLGFGVPMIISRDEDHAPEIEAAIEGQNCLFYDNNDEADLADKMLKIWNSREDWAAKRESISRTCREAYSVEVMGDGLISAFELLR